MKARRSWLVVLVLAISTSSSINNRVAWGFTASTASFPAASTQWSRNFSWRPLEAAAEAAGSSVPSEWQGSVLSKLRNVIDPDLNSDIVTLGFIQNLLLDDDIENTVSFDVELTTPACPVKDQFAADCERLVAELPWVGRVKVTMTSRPSVMDTPTVGLAQVGAIVAVSSCKGGVGKSTTAVNLAFALQQLGATVGILDADVYGPSLPTMVTPDDDVVRFVGRQIAPLTRNGVRLMSFGYVNDGSAVMRGPMVSQLLDQFLAVTHWGPLDYLILDMPPGTGDVQLTLTQRLNITAAVIVTTPTELSFADVVRGIEMFDSVAVPAVAVVENMAYYESTNNENALNMGELKTSIVEKLRLDLELNGDSSTTVDKLADELVEIVVKASRDSSSRSKRIPIFGAGHKHRLAEQFGIEHSFSIPLLTLIAANGDEGTPYVLEYPDSPQAKIYQDLAKSVVSEVAKAKYSNTRPEFEYREDAQSIVVTDRNGGDEAAGPSFMSPVVLRRECRCASCVEEMTGRQLLVKSNVPETVRPRKMYPTGNYALSVDWSDGHRSLYPYRQIRNLLQDEQRIKESQPEWAKAKKQEAVV
jgi:Mrp family chromosome partitioning ATPase/DUF971 family protein